MKKRLTLTLPIEVIKYIKAEAKKQNMTASLFVEAMFLKTIAEEESKEILKKVS